MKKNKETVKVQVPAATPVEVQKQVETEASKIWNEIKNKEMSMFALPGKLVSSYCTPATVEPTKLYLLTTASAVLPALESALGPAYQVDVFNKYTVVSRASQ